MNKCIPFKECIDIFRLFFLTINKEGIVKKKHSIDRDSIQCTLHLASLTGGYFLSFFLEDSFILPGYFCLGSLFYDLSLGGFIFQKIENTAQNSMLLDF